MSKLLSTILILFMLVGAASGQSSDPDLLVVAETHWGFDGRIPLREFVPLSIQLKNLSPTPWQGFLELARVVRGDRQFGATIIEEVTLQGDETRWIQLAPYVIDDLEDWEIRWGDGENHLITLPPVIKGERSTVLVYDTDDVSQGESIFKRMPEERFPTSVTATHGLRGIVLNQVPFWQGARARAFHDWLRLGGRVYLLQDQEGNFPFFPTALSFLNNEQTEFKVGAGVVQKLALKVEDFTLDDARRKIFNDDLKNSEPTNQSKIIKNQPTNGYSSYGMSQLIWSKHYDTFKSLTELSKYKRHWWLIYLAVFSYLAVQYPGCYIVGTEQKNVVRFYLLFFAAAVFFALVFGLLGQVGGQSKNRIRSIVLAQSLEDGDFEITGWTVLSNIYAGSHALAFPGSGQVYTTTQEAEYVNGKLNPGTGGGVAFQMLPDSKRTLYYRSRLRTNLPRPQLLSKDVGDLRTQSLSINIKDCFTEQPIYALAVLQGYVYELEVKANFLELKRAKSPELLASYLQRDYDFGFNMWGTRITSEDSEEEKKFVGLKRYINLVRPAVGNSFGLIDEIDARKLKLDNQTLRLFVLTAIPADFQSDPSDFPDQEGTVLFTYDLKL